MKFLWSHGWSFPTVVNPNNSTTNTLVAKLQHVYSERSIILHLIQALQLLVCRIPIVFCWTLVSISIAADFAARAAGFVTRNIINQFTISLDQENLCSKVLWVLTRKTQELPTLLRMWRINKQFYYRHPRLWHFEISVSKECLCEVCMTMEISFPTGLNILWSKWTSGLWR